MRRIWRVRLGSRTARYIRRKQDEVESGADVSTTWARSRRTVSMAKVLEALRRMAGLRVRCMFCEDSRGTDIDHFWPKSRHPAKAFAWANMLLVCSACNRKKGDRFALDADGRPVLIDPTTEDPWSFLFFGAETGMVTARFGADGEPDLKGAHTTDPGVLPLNIEAVTEGRVRTRRNLSRAVERFFEQIQLGVGTDKAGRELVEAVKDNDAYGLSQWYFVRDGKDDEPFAQLRATHPRVWIRVQDTIA